MLKTLSLDLIIYGYENVLTELLDDVELEKDQFVKTGMLIRSTFIIILLKDAKQRKQDGDSTLDITEAEYQIIENYVRNLL